MTVATRREFGDGVLARGAAAVYRTLVIEVLLLLAAAPGLAGLFGLRVEETDAQPPEIVNPVSLGGTVSDARLVFELLVPEGAEVVGTYGADFYAGTPAVTRHRPQDGGGEAWYVGTGLDDAGVEWVVRKVLDPHGLTGPYADVEDLELAVRERDGVRFGFLLHHGVKPVEVPAYASGVDLLTGRRVTEGETLHLDPTDVLVLRED
ncbi:beta-galactosidase trimerization domain-containing protein [Pseudonocardia nigra]|uniref:beta-galactosidase trimerization domain-containing protein n=1 Tax=Pseudonocardia nigra TaxID=1921578 RepID=UPI001C5EA913|nr:beta-galactosidase trimerization domain-containing protein [Pseudonocardia nigra]